MSPVRVSPHQNYFPVKREAILLPIPCFSDENIGWVPGWLDLGWFKVVDKAPRAEEAQQQSSLLGPQKFSFLICKDRLHCWLYSLHSRVNSFIKS